MTELLDVLMAVWRDSAVLVLALTAIVAMFVRHLMTRPTVDFDWMRDDPEFFFNVMNPEIGFSENDPPDYDR
ncbi:MAG: hypothetical protein GZ085_01950 [Sulfuriferula multivorans]|uniref:Uncharacterized protein n=1 Tax=Sulfuriferula multivorans TaxID=1559896 RepID=A0A7C9JVG5_9PROT|nr:hypothetical protein [Sulfuriferula multivorans]